MRGKHKRLDAVEAYLRAMTIPFFSLATPHAHLKTEAQGVFEAFWDSGQYVLGSMTRQFEADYAAFGQVRHCVGVSNGLDALHLALRVLGIGPGHAVVVPSNAYIAAWLAVTHAGATPVPVEPDPHTCNLDPTRLEAALRPDVRAILPVHLYGQACDMSAIRAVADRHDLLVVEDNAQAQGARHADRPTGAWGHVNATSFYPTKNLGALGEAGAITTDSDAYADAARTLRNYGSQVRYLNDLQGFNCRIDELQAGLLSLKLRHLATWTAERIRQAERYHAQLADVPDLQLPATAAGSTHTYHQFVVQSVQRDALQVFLQKKGVGTLVHYPVPPHLQAAYRALGYQRGDFPVAEQLAERSLSLPLYVGLGDAEIDYVCAQIRAFHA
jgi:dTDP-4-amino-4,6-dideoxygalactose transaminase